MPVHYITKDVTTVTDGLVMHGANCQGVMGSGVAVQIKTVWPRAWKAYKQVCEANAEDGRTTKDLLGDAVIVRVDAAQLYVSNCFTQDRYGYDGQRYADPEAIRESFALTFEFAKGLSLDVYMPRIGCDRGGLSWKDDVEGIVDSLAEMYDINVYVCDLP